MADDHLVQAPLLVFPQSFLRTTESFFNRINATDLVLAPSLDEDRCDQLLALAANLEADFPHLSRGAAYLREITAARQPQRCPVLKFIESGPGAVNRGLVDLQLGQRPPAPRPHKLKVVFHHLPQR